MTLRNLFVGSVAEASILDDFNRANQDPIAGNWSGPVFVGSSQLRIVSNELGCFVSDTGQSYWNAATFGPDVEVSATMSGSFVEVEQDAIYLMARLASPNTTGVDCYDARWIFAAGSVLGVRIRRIVDGTPTVLAEDTDAGTSLADGDKVRFTVTGTGATVTLDMHTKRGAADWELSLTVGDTDAARLVSAGYVAARMDDNLSNDLIRMDDFNARTL